MRNAVFMVSLFGSVVVAALLFAVVTVRPAASSGNSALMGAARALAVSCYKEGFAAGQLQGLIKQLEAANLPVPDSLRKLIQPTAGCKDNSK